MGTNLILQPTDGRLVTEMQAPNPVRKVRVASETRDADFSSIFIDLHYAYGGGGDHVRIAFDDIDMVVDALLEHQAARTRRLEQAVTIGEGQRRREKLRQRFMERRKK